MSIDRLELSDEQIKEQILDIGRQLYLRNYVVSNDGNISAMVRPGVLWVTPTGISKGYMASEMLVCVDLDGNVLEGTHLPSSELKMHLRVYKENPEVRAVVHAHPNCATAFAVAGIPLDDPTLVEAIMQLGAVPVARYGKPGTQAVPDSVAPFCRSYNGVLLSNHGALTWGTSLTQAFTRMEILETYAKTMFITKLLGQSRPLSKTQIAELNAAGDGTTLLPLGGDALQNDTDVLPAARR